LRFAISQNSYESSTKINPRWQKYHVLCVPDPVIGEGGYSQRCSHLEAKANGAILSLLATEAN